MTRRHGTIVMLLATLSVAPPASASGSDSARVRAPQSVPASGRLVGVFDDATGKPLEGVEVSDVLTGWSARTTTTGTARLSFVDSGGSLIRFRKAGYVPVTLPVANSARDTIPVTVVLRPAAQLLPTVRTTALSSRRGPADTLRKLDLVGYYDRRNTQGAPESAFVTFEKIEKLALVSDVLYVNGRGVCPKNVYVDGVLVDPPDLNRTRNGRRTEKVFKNGIDAIIDPSEIAAIELYTHVGEIPAEFNRTLPNGAPTPCATLIWTK